MNYTPFDGLSNDELVLVVLNNAASTALENELAKRLIDQDDEIEDLKHDPRG